MELRGKINGMMVDWMSGNLNVTLALNSFPENIAELREKDLDIAFKEHREHRSLNANNYAWKLINEIANRLRTSKEDVYLEMLKRYGQHDMVSVISGIDVKPYFKYYEVAGETELQGKMFTHYKIYKGSSEMDTREMSILIDGICEEAKALGIETMTPNELIRLKEAWNETKSGDK